MSLKKRDIARAINAAEPHVSVTEAVALADLVIEGIKRALSEHGKVMITDFGTFEVVDRAPRRGVSPATGEPITIPAHRAVTFQPSPALRRSVEG